MLFMKFVNNWGIPLDIISISIIFFIIVVCALIILCKTNISLEKKFSLTALPLSIVYAGTVLADSLHIK